VSNLSFSASYAASGARAHNIVFTFNNATMDNAAKVIPYNEMLKRLNSNSKWIIIENNIEKDKTTVDAKILAKLDYHVLVSGGKAEAVFSEATGGDASTSTLMGFRITSDTEGLVPFGNGKMLVADENGLYDLSVLYTRDIEITFAEAEAIYSDGETVTVLSDCEITVAELEHRYKEGYIFLGWKLNGAYTSATVSVRAGDKLTAEYAAYNAAEQFYVKGIQMRTTGAQGVRFILSKQNSLDNILIGAGLSIKEFGSLILPVELTHGKDMEYGKPIYKGDTTEILGTPSAVKADKLYAETESGVEYTVVVTGISAEKYYRFYAVQGYLVYTDANGNEQVVYSTYGQSSLYRAALHLAADEEAGESAKTQAQAVIDYVQNVRPESYKNYYLASVEKTDLGYTAVKGENYALANGLKVVEFTFDFFGGQGEAINIVNFADIHLNYVNKQDFGAADPITMSEYLNRGWNKNGGNAVDALRAMEFASFADKTIITGDTYDYYSYGGFQMAQRLLYNYNNEIGTYTDAKGITRNNTSVLVAIGNHEPFKRFEGTIPYVSDHEALADSLNAKWNNDIVYHSEDIVKGENAVKVVVLNNQSRKITREEILTKLTADIEAARSAGTKILVFQHVPFYECSDEDVEGTLTIQVYELIKGYADVVKAVIAGDVHNYDYRETEGTNGTLVEITTGAIAEYDENSVCNIIIK
ncbi:MAG: metallophosphoesterase, partial [Clostridia bacterium]|nr:metallophosphoesterase [Clostridia bacterium]